MAKGIFLYREDSRYDDRPWEVYQFPEPYLSRASQIVGDWVIFMEPVKAGRKGYHAVGKVEQITPDPRNMGMYLAIVDPASYLEFDRNVPFKVAGNYPERSVLNEAGKVSGRAQSAVRTIPDADFNRIVSLGLDAGGMDLLPRTDAESSDQLVAEEQTPYQFEQDRTQMLTLRTVRDRIFRTVVLKAYGSAAVRSLDFSSSTAAVGPKSRLRISSQWAPRDQTLSKMDLRCPGRCIGCSTEAYSLYQETGAFCCPTRSMT